MEIKTLFFTEEEGNDAREGCKFLEAFCNMMQEPDNAKKAEQFKSRIRLDGKDLNGYIAMAPEDEVKEIITLVDRCHETVRDGVIWKFKNYLDAYQKQ